MKLYEKRAADGTSLEKCLDTLLAKLDERCAGSRELFVHLRDVHDGAASLERSIAELSAVEASDVEAVDRLLWDIHVELYEHLLPNHLEAMRQRLSDLCDCLAEGVE